MGEYNFNTENIRWWIQHDPWWYGMTCIADDYESFVEIMDAAGVVKTPDGVSLMADDLDTDALDNDIIWGDEYVE